MAYRKPNKKTNLPARLGLLSNQEYEDDVLWGVEVVDERGGGNRRYEVRLYARDEGEAVNIVKNELLNYLEVYQDSNLRKL